MASCLWRKIAENGLPRVVQKRNFSCQLFVSRLSFYVTEKELKEAFLQFGKITEARLVMDERYKRPKGFGFVTYESEADAQKALNAMNNRIFQGRLIFVEVAKSTPNEKTTGSQCPVEEMN